MSEKGQKQTGAAQKAMSAVPPNADMRGATTNVRFGPYPDVSTKQVRVSRGRKGRGRG